MTADLKVEGRPDEKQILREQSAAEQRVVAERDNVADYEIVDDRDERCPNCDLVLLKTPSGTTLKCACEGADDLAILREHRRSELRTPVDVAIAHLIDAGTVLGLAHAEVMKLEDERPLIKAKCIEEMIGTPNAITGKPHSATSAEAVVEKHNDYWQHRQKQIAAEIHKHEAEASYEAHKLRARLLVAFTSAGVNE